MLQDENIEAEAVVQAWPADEMEPPGPSQPAANPRPDNADEEQAGLDRTNSTTVAHISASLHENGLFSFLCIFLSTIFSISCLLCLFLCLLLLPALFILSFSTAPSLSLSLPPVGPSGVQCVVKKPPVVIFDSDSEDEEGPVRTQAPGQPQQQQQLTTYPPEPPQPTGKTTTAEEAATHISESLKCSDGHGYSKYLNLR